MRWTEDNREKLEIERERNKVCLFVKDGWKEGDKESEKEKKNEGEEDRGEE